MAIFLLDFSCVGLLGNFVMLSQPKSVPDTPSLLPVYFPIFFFLFFSILILFPTYFTSVLPDGYLSHECPHGMQALTLPAERRKCCSSPCLCGCVPHVPVRAEPSSVLCPFPPQHKWGSQQQVTRKNNDDEEEEEEDKYQLSLWFLAAGDWNYILKLGIQRNWVPWRWCSQLVQKNLNKWDFSACRRSCCLLGAVKEWAVWAREPYQHPWLAGWLSFLSPYWTNRLHTNTFIFIPLGIFCQVIHLEPSKIEMPFLQKFHIYLLWIVEQAKMHAAGRLLAWSTLPPCSLIAGMPGFTPFLQQAVHSYSEWHLRGAVLE